jgi:hypothetical protein
MIAAKALLFAGFASTVIAFQQAGDTDACTPFEACSCKNYFILRAPMYHSAVANAQHFLLQTDTYTGIDATAQEVTVTATGNCNAQGECLGNGAVCANDDQCYSQSFSNLSASDSSTPTDKRASRVFVDFCSPTTGTCGGLGAECYSRNADVEYGGLYVVCDTPGKC